MENTVSPYLYDIFPWISEIIAKNGVNTEGISSVKQMLTAVKDALPTDGSVTMPDVAADGYIDRSLPAAAVLENGSVITFNYDDMYRLCSLEKDGEDYAVFSWKYDTQSGKSILREYCIDDLQYEYTDLVVAENSLYGKYENIARYAYVTKAADDSFDITYDYETGEELSLIHISEPTRRS